MHSSDTDGFIVKNMWIYVAKEEILQVDVYKVIIQVNGKHQTESVKMSLHMYVT